MAASPAAVSQGVRVLCRPFFAPLSSSNPSDADSPTSQAAKKTKRGKSTACVCARGLGCDWKGTKGTSGLTLRHRMSPHVDKLGHEEPYRQPHCWRRGC